MFGTYRDTGGQLSHACLTGVTHVFVGCPLGVRWVFVESPLGVRWVSLGCQLGVSWVSDTCQPLLSVANRSRMDPGPPPGAGR